MADGAISLWGASQLLGHFFGQAIVWPSSLYMALIRQIPPGPFTEGGELDEPEDGLGYARAEIINTSINWITDQESTSNAEDIVFAPALATWGDIRYWALCNDITGGQIYYYGDFIEPVPSAALDEFVVAAGTLNFVIGPIFSGVNDGS